jgi:hypothetical protein
MGGVSDGIRTRDRRYHNPSDGVCGGLCSALARGFSTLPYPLMPLTLHHECTVGRPGRERRLDDRYLAV